MRFHLPMRGTGSIPGLGRSMCLQASKPVPQLESLSHCDKQLIRLNKTKTKKLRSIGNRGDFLTLIRTSATADVTYLMVKDCFPLRMTTRQEQYHGNYSALNNNY